MPIFVFWGAMPHRFVGFTGGGGIIGSVELGADPSGRGGNPKKIWELGSRHVNSVYTCVIVQSTEGTEHV